MRKSRKLEIALPSLDPVLTYSKKFVHEVDQEQFEQGLRNLYKHYFFSFS